MKTSWMAGVCAAGFAAVGWVGWGFVGTSPLALAMTALIGAVYGLGAYELMRFCGATAGLAAALAEIPQPLNELGTWLDRLPASLRAAVRERIDGARTPLPGPALAPYLVGLLVMLGMLGTFLGMVVTFKGAVFALEASASLEAIRSALAAPIKGLGLSFGTSVAGVAASAALGLMLALCRRERLEAARLLDARIATVLRPFSAVHRREAMFEALHAQAQAMPLIAERLHGLAQGLERRHGELDAQLLARQQDFHHGAGQAYTRLAESVGRALHDSLEAGARQASQLVGPVVERAMSTLLQEARQAHQGLREAAHAQTQTLSSQWGDSVRQVAATWEAAQRSQGQAQTAQVAQLEAAVRSAVQAVEQRSGALQAALRETVLQAQAAQAEADGQRMAQWERSMHEAAGTLVAQWREAQAAALAQQQRLYRAAEEASAQAAAAVAGQTRQTLEGTARLLDQADALVRDRRETEARWVQAQGQRMDRLADTWRVELAALRDQEAARERAALERLDGLQAAVAQQLAALGAALEAPLTRMLQTASAVPQAAAEAMAQLRQEVARLGERDTAALAERSALLRQIGGLLGAMDETAQQQRAGIDTLVAGAAAVLEQAGEQFSQSLRLQAGRVDEAAAHVAASAVELSSLGDAFGHGAALFSASAGKLVGSLERVEEAIGHSLGRSDEQLAYYVAQAREVIDLSITSQQGIIEDLRRLHGEAREAAR